MSINLSESIFLSLGSNLGDRSAALQGALTELTKENLTIVQTSTVYETEPVGLREQPDFLNLVTQVQTPLDPPGLLGLCRTVEEKFGRRRTRLNGPRSIDIDILLFGQRIVDLPELKIPHPSYHLRRFVLVPLAELAAGFRDPCNGRSVSELLQSCPDQSWVRPWGQVELTVPSSL